MPFLNFARITGKSPQSPLEFYRPPLTQVPPSVSTPAFEEDGDWWSGSQNSFACIALTLVLAATLVTSVIAAQIQQVDEPLPTPAISDDFWQNPVTPAIQKIPPSVFSDDDVIVPQVIAFSSDEDFWENPVVAVSAVFIYPQQSTFDVQEPAGSLFGQPDEDFWQNPVAPVVAILAYPQQSSFDVQEPAGSLHGQPDEDFWINSVAPIQATLSYPQQFSFDVKEPAGSLFGQPDEDFWLNPVQRIQAILGRIYLPDTVEIPANTLHGQPDEDFWVNQVRPVVLQVLSSAFSDDDVIVQQSSPVLDEDFWLNQVPSTQATLGK